MGVVIIRILTIITALALLTCPAEAQRFNFPDRKALVIDVCPHLKITDFSFENTMDSRLSSMKNTFTYHWKNVGSQSVIAFEIVTLKYDPFDEPLPGSRTLIAGHDSANFSPLGPGESSGDGTIGYGHIHVLTAIAYIRAVRFADGTAWRAEPDTVAAEVKKVAPRIKDTGPLVPEREKKDEKK